MFYVCFFVSVIQRIYTGSRFLIKENRGTRVLCAREMPRHSAGASSQDDSFFVSGYICKNCQQISPTQVQIFTGNRALQSAFGHIGGSRQCRAAKLGLQEIRIPFGARDAAVGGSGAAAGPALVQASSSSRLATIYEG